MSRHGRLAAGRSCSGRADAAGWVRRHTPGTSGREHGPPAATGGRRRGGAGCRPEEGADGVMAPMDREQEFVLGTLEERDIRFVRLWFTDVSGYLKAVAVAPAEIEAASAAGIAAGGRAIEGFARVYESDMLAKPDPA